MFTQRGLETNCSSEMSVDYSFFLTFLFHHEYPTILGSSSSSQRHPAEISLWCDQWGCGEKRGRCSEGRSIPSCHRHNTAGRDSQAVSGKCTVNIGANFIGF